MPSKLKKPIFLFCLLIAATYSTGCDSDNGVEPAELKTKFETGVIVINEGGWGQNNSGITLKSYSNDSVYNNLFQAVNTEALGDVANSVTVSGGNAYISVTGSNKVEVVRLTDFKKTGSVDLSAYPSPRHVVFSNGYGYVTCLGADKVVKFDAGTLGIISSIPVGSKPEDITVSGNYLYIANSGYGSGNTVTVIDTKTDKAVKTLRVGTNPQYFATGSDNNVYVSCAGSYSDAGVFSGLWKINVSTMTVADSISVSQSPSKVISFTAGKLLVTNGEGVVSVDISSKQSSVLIPVASVSTSSYPIIYSVAYDSQKNLIYCGNPKDFKQNGEVVIFSTDGKTKRGSFDAGLNPGAILIIR